MAEAVAGTDLGNSSEYSNELRTLRADMEKVPAPTVFVRGLGGPKTCESSLRHDVVRHLPTAGSKGKQACIPVHTYSDRHASIA